MKLKEPIREIVVATTNRGKLAELKALLADQGLRVRGLDEFGELAEAVENGVNFAENARQKAKHYGKLLGRWVLADDSGLMVEALDGAPGVISARFAGVEGAEPRKRDQANNAKLLQLLAEIAADERTARFCCCLCLCHGTDVVFEGEGVWEGVILTEGRGSNGFGYDPLFYDPQLGKTAAELADEQKNKVSHRGQALRKLLTFLEQTGSNQEG